ncbi:hypothetical protein [Chryseobacterium soli]|uniref:hypothetical protein n=1 Tax=Chryseobacterium soli TaxID=445961 RepID=UPI0006902CCB|nr:hypothetical protein [Chryseobacterium soli]
MKKLFITALLVGTFSLSYAQSDYYNDYRRSISDVNWQTVAADLLLSATQTKQLYSLNDRYNDYNSWNKVYVHNPDRWRDDRYSEIERIMGREKYTKFKTKYYKGQNPTAIYNRNKNNDKRYKHMEKKAKSHKYDHDNENDHDNGNGNGNGHRH